MFFRGGMAPRGMRGGRGMPGRGMLAGRGMPGRGMPMPMYRMPVSFMLS